MVSVIFNISEKLNVALMNIGDPLSTPPATILPLSHDTLLLAIIRLIICFLYHLKNYVLIVIQLERLVRHSSSTEETHWSLQVLTEEMKCNPTSFFLISIILYFRSYFIIIGRVFTSNFSGRLASDNRKSRKNTCFSDSLKVIFFCIFNTSRSPVLLFPVRYIKTM